MSVMLDIYVRDNVIQPRLSIVPMLQCNFVTVNLLFMSEIFSSMEEINLSLDLDNRSLFINSDINNFYFKELITDLGNSEILNMLGWFYNVVNNVNSIHYLFEIPFVGNVIPENFRETIENKLNNKTITSTKIAGDVIYMASTFNSLAVGSSDSFIFISDENYIKLMFSVNEDGFLVNHYAFELTDDKPTKFDRELTSYLEVLDMNIDFVPSQNLITEIEEIFVD